MNTQDRKKEIYRDASEKSFRQAILFGVWPLAMLVILMLRREDGPVYWGSLVLLCTPVLTNVLEGLSLRRKLRRFDEQAPDLAPEPET